MQAKKRTLWILGGLLIAAAAALALVTILNQAAEESDSAAAVISLSDFSASEVQAITYTREGQQLRLALQDDTWTLADDPDYHVNQTTVESMVTALCPMQAVRSIEAAGSASEYGLDDPSLTVTAELTDGSSKTFYFGDSNSVTGDVYLQVEGDSTIYAAASSKVSCFAYDKAGLYDTGYSPVTLTSDEITGIRYAFADDTEQFQVSMEAVSEPVASDETASSAADSGASASAASDSGSAVEYEKVWYLENSGDQLLESDINEMISQIRTAPSAQNTAPGDLAQYGLDAPLITVQLIGSDGTEQTFYLGIGTDGYYMMEKDDSSVYTITVDVLNAFSITADELKMPSRMEEAGLDEDAAFSTELDETA